MACQAPRPVRHSSCTSAGIPIPAPAISRWLLATARAPGHRVHRRGTEGAGELPDAVAQHVGPVGGRQFCEECWRWRDLPPRWRWRPPRPRTRLRHLLRDGHAPDEVFDPVGGRGGRVAPKLGVGGVLYSHVRPSLIGKHGIPSEVVPGARATRAPANSAKPAPLLRVVRGGSGHGAAAPGRRGPGTYRRTCIRILSSWCALCRAGGLAHDQLRGQSQVRDLRRLPADQSHQQLHRVLAHRADRLVDGGQRRGAQRRLGDVVRNRPLTGPRARAARGPARPLSSRSP